MNVARASLDELLLDYEDFLRQRGLAAWGKDDPQALKVRAVGKSGTPTAETYAPWLRHADPAVIANTLICLIHQANYLLDRQIHGLERQFVEGGGYSERLADARLEERRRQKETRSDQTDQTDRTDRSEKELTCAACGKAMVSSTARKGLRAGSQFWGCSGYPECTETMPV